MERTKALDPAIRTLLIADDANEALAREALARGCDGICFESGLFMPALRVVAGGGIYYPQPVAAVLRQQQPAAPIEPLTERERVVLNHLMLGLTDQRISQELMVSPETVRIHVKHIFQKLQVDNRTKAVVKSIAAGLIRTWNRPWRFAGRSRAEATRTGSWPMASSSCTCATPKAASSISSTASSAPRWPPSGSPAPTGCRGSTGPGRSSPSTPPA
ncbi:response regulator transcription factor [Microcystis elabens FACHB-917]|nr:response regulator transcription factor [Microcystis elabens FACHB-917]